MPMRKDFENTEEFERALRDWFASQALVGLVSGAAGNTTSMSGAMAAAEHAGRSINQYFASGAFAIADAILAERAKP